MLLWSKQKVFGQSLNISASGIFLQTCDVPPPEGIECRMVLDLPEGLVEATGQVARSDPERGQVAVRIDRFTRNGALYLARMFSGRFS